MVHVVTWDALLPYLNLYIPTRYENCGGINVGQILMTESTRKILMENWTRREKGHFMFINLSWKGLHTTNEHFSHCGKYVDSVAKIHNDVKSWFLQCLCKRLHKWWLQLKISFQQYNIHVYEICCRIIYQLY